MNLKKCLRVLNLEQAASKSDVEQAYREMIDTWQPERFTPNSPLRIQAEEQLKEINIAYKKLITYLSPNHAGNKLAMLEAEPAASYAKSSNATTPKTDNYLRTNDDPKPSKPTPKKVAGAVPTAGTGSSLAGKYVVLGLLLIFAAITAVILKYLADVDQSPFESKPQSSILKRLTPDGSASTPGTKPKYSKDKPAKSKKREQEQRPKKTTQLPRYFEIHLKEGNIIIAEKWWEENNMIMYKTNYGTMGIEKSTIKKIISK